MSKYIYIMHRYLDRFRNRCLVLLKGPLVPDHRQQQSPVVPTRLTLDGIV